MENKKEKNKKEGHEYGEFISSYFAWKTLDEQKQMADKLANITKDKDE